MDQSSDKCDQPTDSTQNLMAAIFFGLHLAGIIPHLCVFPATFQLAKKLSAFMLLLTINVMHFLLLLWGVYFYGQYFIGQRIRLTSLDLDAFVFQIAHSNSMALYVFLSLNRAVAIIFPLKYDVVFSVRKTKFCITVCLIYSTAYSIFANYRPALRYSMCLQNLQPFFPPAMITEPDLITSLILTIGTVFLTITTLTPPILYCICVIYMVFGIVKKAFFSSTANYPPPASNNAIDHLLRERTRLYLICLLGTLPPFILFLLPIVQQMLAIHVFFTPFYAIFHIQQPILMMALSVKLQHEMLKVFKNTLKLILGTPSATNGSTSFVVIRHAWT